MNKSRHLSQNQRDIYDKMQSRSSTIKTILSHERHQQKRQQSQQRSNNKFRLISSHAYKRHQIVSDVVSSKPTSLALSLAIGLVLAAIHSAALNSQPQPQQQQQQAQATTPKPAAAPLASMDQSPSINLIPVDQPVGGASMVAVNGRQKLEPVAGTYESSNIGAGPLRSAAEPSEPADSSGDDSASLAAGPQPQADDEFSEPSAGQFYAMGEGQFEQQKDNSQQQQKLQEVYTFEGTKLDPSSGPIKTTQDGAAQPQRQQQQIVERRFGLFKKGQHYGTPMSANYASAAPFMTDCERCLAGLGQQSADLQQLDPLPPALPAQPSVQPVPLAPANHFGMQPFAPLKNKLFMKFPFFVKPMTLGDSHTTFVPSHYWPAPAQPQYHPPSNVRPAPAMTNALFIRPPPAYNCIQATPPLVAVASANQAEVAPLGTKSPTKQYPHQQNVYSSSSY